MISRLNQVAYRRSLVSSLLATVRACVCRQSYTSQPRETSLP